MKFGQKMRAAFVGIVSWGLLLQQTPTFAAPPAAADTAATVTLNEAKPSEFKTAPRKAPPPAAIDVALAKDGVASGRVLDADQKGIANARVSFRQGKEEIAQATTDLDGRFAVQNLKGGVYLITSSSGYGLFRFWAKKSAPPAARDQVLLRSNAVIVRAQNPEDSGEVFYDDNGQPYARVHVVDDGVIASESSPPVGSGGLCCLDILTLALLGTAITALVLALENNAEDKGGESHPSSP